MSKRSSDTISLLHTDGIYPPSRSITMFGDIDEHMFSSVFNNLHILDSTDGTITIYINSDGGDLDQGMAIYDAIAGCKNYVRMIVVGHASSAASLVLQAADERLMTPSSYIMIHAGEESTEGHPEIKKKWDAKFQKDKEWMEDLYLEKIKNKKPKFAKNKLSEMLKFDTIFTAKEAIEIGLADGIVQPKVR